MLLLFCTFILLQFRRKTIYSVIVVMMMMMMTNFLVYSKGPSIEQKLGYEHGAIEAAVPAAIRAVTIRTTPHAFRREACGVFAFYGLL